jgi:glycosyltransferase involved in cell wall biosynthesis
MAAEHPGPGGDRPRRILMLVPHDPHADPRVQWAAKLCAGVARTELLCMVHTPVGPDACDDGVVRTEQFRIPRYEPPAGRLRRWLVRALNNRPAFGRFTTRPLHAPAEPARGARARLRRARDYHWGGLCYTAVQLDAELRVLTGAMRARVREVTEPPRLVICNEVWTLPAGLDLKRRFGTRVLYDAHEFTPHASLVSHPLEQWFWKQYEGRLARQADAFITVTPQLAAEYRRQYGLRQVHSVPNAEPFTRPRAPSCDREVRYPVRFLVQGQASPGRGFEQLLGGWRRLADPRALLLIRCPRRPYLDALESAHADLVARGTLRFLEAVPPEELVEAATAADVGVIPYAVKVGEYARNLNHLYCCPNKLSQYMQAGLAVLSTNSVFVGSCLEKYDSGLVYDPERPETLVQAVRAFLDDPGRLQQMKRNAFRWVEAEFNWEVQSLPYRRLIEAFTLGARGTPPAPARRAA